MSVEVLKIKSVPISLSVSGTPAEGYKYTGYSSEPETVQIYGEKDVVDKIEEIDVPVIDVAELHNRFRNLSISQNICRKEFSW